MKLPKQASGATYTKYIITSGAAPQHNNLINFSNAYSCLGGFGYEMKQSQKEQKKKKHLCRGQKGTKNGRT
jgi:hypothetical protein